MKKVKKFITKNIKLLVGITIGLIISGTCVYASTILYQGNNVSFDNTNANLTLNNQPVDNMQDAMDALYQQIPKKCTTSPFKPGDYVEMTPTSISYPVDTALRGNATAVTLDPSELNLWRVIRVNADCTVEMVSEYVSSLTVQFKGKLGYMNYIYVLNEIAKQYANTAYTLDPSTAPDGAFRNLGYDGQTKQITNDTRLIDQNLGTASGAWYKKTTSINGEESLGGGDQGFSTDLKLLNDAGISYLTYKCNITTPTTYWLASRLFYWSSTSNWYFRARFVTISGSSDNSNLYYRNSSSFYEYYYDYSVRPVVTLDSRVGVASGAGTSASHYSLTAIS